MTNIKDTQERKRIIAAENGKENWKSWGPYLSERQWGTVREDYSEGGSAWDYFSHDQARSRAYRWGEDGLMGISDNQQRLCLAIALWNGADPIIKERLFGLTNSQGNHGEDVKEYYFYLDSTPTHSYMKGLYKYPQAAFPYEQLIEQNRDRNRTEPEYELVDTGVFDGDRYFDVFVEYAKNTPDDVLMQITVVNHAPEAKELHLAPQLWFRNTWSWETEAPKPSLKAVGSNSEFSVIEADSDADTGKRWLYCENADEVLYTDNETNDVRFGWAASNPGYVKDGINDYIVEGHTEAVNPQQVGTKAASYYKLNLAAGETKIVRLRLSDVQNMTTPFGSAFDSIIEQRQSEADEFYEAITPCEQLATEMRNIQRQAFAGMLWSKQYYNFNVERWLKGDPTQPTPPAARKQGRNHKWTHLDNEDIISMPDKWEYPWYAAWDLAFHCLPISVVDPDFAKNQLDIMTREWYMHPNGQIPAYEWAFGDVNPPVHAWAPWRVYK
ncbi:MAG: glucosidase, partial [Cyanobacteria bacterium J06598_4]